MGQQAISFSEPRHPTRLGEINSEQRSQDQRVFELYQANLQVAMSTLSARTQYIIATPSDTWLRGDSISVSFILLLRIHVKYPFLPSPLYKISFGMLCL